MYLHLFIHVLPLLLSTVVPLAPAILVLNIFLVSYPTLHTHLQRSPVADLFLKAYEYSNMYQEYSTVF